MATAEQRTRLLAVCCPYCGAADGEVCAVARPVRVDGEGGKRRHAGRPITTLDGGMHDARWLAAGLGPAPVLTGAVVERHPRPIDPGTVAVLDRPW